MQRNLLRTKYRTKRSDNTKQIMRNRIVMWATNADEKKILIALDLVAEENKVNTYIFNEDVATESFFKQMKNDWREGKEVEFPEPHESTAKDLTVADDLLPEGIKVERHDVILRAKTEWHFIVLSGKMYQMFKSELEEIEQKVKEATKYERGIWDEMVQFWDKVQKNVIDKNLFRDHGRTLKDKTNELFDELKSLRKTADTELKKVSKVQFGLLVDKLQAIEAKIEKGLGLQPIFNELKNIHKDSKEASLTRDDRGKIWKKIDAAFQVVKDKRGMTNKKGGGSGKSRVAKRMEGLQGAIKRMEQSIGRDLKDKEFETRRMSQTDGQLEMQIRQAKLAMVEQRISSKEEKLMDMHKTRKELEKKLEKEIKKEEKREVEKKVEAKKEEIKAKIAEDIKSKNEEMSDEAKKLEEAALKIKEGKKPKAVKTKKEEKPQAEKEATDKNEEKAETEEAVKSVEGTGKEENVKKEDIAGIADSDTAAEKPDNIIEAISNTVGEALENVVDTVKAVAAVVEDRIEETLESLSEEE